MESNKLEAAMRKYFSELLQEKKYVSVVDLLMKLNYLSKADYEKWRFGKIDFLEKVCGVNLSKLNFILKKLNSISTELNLKKSWTAYTTHGKGPKKKLRFSKSNDELTEKRYATHHILQNLKNKNIESEKGIL